MIRLWRVFDKFFDIEMSNLDILSRQWLILSNLGFRWPVACSDWGDKSSRMVGWLCMAACLFIEMTSVCPRFDVRLA